MTDPQFSVDPTRVRHLAGRLDALAGRADRLTSRAEAGADTPSAAQFPSADAGQRAAKLWTDTRRTSADGLRLVRQRLAQLATDYRAVADNYQDADTAAARQLGTTRPPGAGR